MDLGDNSIAYIYVAYKTSEKSLKKIPKEYLCEVGGFPKKTHLVIGRVGRQKTG